MLRGQIGGSRMMLRDAVLALLVVTVWGANFTVIKLGLGGVPPMLLAALRYAFTALPALFFVGRPAIGWQYYVAYGLTVGVGQFACLFYAMDIGISAGIASVVLQSQAFFTLLFAVLLLKESLTGSQLLGFGVAALGLIIIGSNVGTAGISIIPVSAFLLTLLAAAFWGLSNIIVRKASQRAAADGKKLEMLSLVVWSSLVPPLPLLGFALMLDSSRTIIDVLLNLNTLSVFAILYLAYAATIFGFGTWSGLLARYPAGQVAPLSLLVPVTGLLTAQIVLGEKLSALQWTGGVVIMLGLAISSFGLPKVLSRHREKSANL